MYITYYMNFALKIDSFRTYFSSIELTLTFSHIFLNNLKLESSGTT